MARLAIDDLSKRCGSATTVGGAVALIPMTAMLLVRRQRG